MMELMPLGADDEQKRFSSLLSRLDAPAYQRRGRAVQDALAALHARCAQQREELLKMPRLRLGRLAALAGAWERLAPWLSDDRERQQLKRLHEELAPKLRVPIEMAASEGPLKAELQALVASLERFNRRLAAFLAKQELEPINALIAGYNRHYVFEKECVVRSPRLARHGFEPLPPVTLADLSTLHPPLPVPRLRAEG